MVPVEEGASGMMTPPESSVPIMLVEYRVVVYVSVDAAEVTEISVL